MVPFAGKKGHRCALGNGTKAMVPYPPSETKVADLQDAVGGNHHVACGQVAVDDLVGVDVRHTGGHLVRLEGVEAGKFKENIDGKEYEGGGSGEGGGWGGGADGRISDLGISPSEHPALRTP